MKRKLTKKPSAKSATKESARSTVKTSAKQTRTSSTKPKSKTSRKSGGKKPDTASAKRREAASARRSDLVREPRTDWTEVAAIRENKLLGIDDGWFNNAYLVQPPPKERISIRLDRDVLEFFRSQGRGYQSRINRVLQAFVEQSKRK